MQNFCGMRLTTVGVVIGWLGAAISLFSIIILGLALGNIDAVVKAFAEHVGDKPPSDDNIRAAVVVVCTVYLTINAINLLASALLIIGTIKERHLLLLPWLINAGISLVLGTIYLIFFTVVSLASDSPFGSTALSLSTSLPFLVIQFCIWNAIRSLFKQLQAGREEQQHLIRSTGASYPSYSKI